jgi:ATP-dependent DNA helicase RecQ
MAYGLEDVTILRKMLQNSEADEAHKRVELQKLNAMLALCETVSCRRQQLLAYFGDNLEQPCGNCDNCLELLEIWNASIPAQQALSCIYRTGQRFGAVYLTDVLLGKNLERIRQFNHDKQSTFGIGKSLDKNQWLLLFRQLLAYGFVITDEHGAFKLTEQCRPILRGQQQLMLRKDSKKPQAETIPKTPSKGIAANYLLWEALRNKRKEIAEAQKVPAYVIFHDATLMEMMEKKPASLTQFAQLSGVGQHKLEAYGDAFLRVIYQFAAKPNGLSETVSESLSLLQAGYMVEQIAAHRGLKLTTIYGHLADAVAEGLVELERVITLPATEVRQIQEVILALPEEQKNSLKPVFETFAGAYSYDVLRCIKAQLL